MNEKQALTIIVPIFNEEECLPLFYKTMDSFLAKTTLACTVLLVNDGSTDDSRKQIKQKSREHSQYTYLDLDKNYGLSTAIKAGIDYAKTNYIAYIDADLQTHPDDFEDLMATFPNVDMANGFRQKRKDRLVKRLSSKIANAIRRAVVNDGIIDSGCPLKVITADMAKSLPFFDGMHRFIPALVQLKGGRVSQVPIRHFPRVAGTAKYHLFNRLVGPFLDMLAFYWMRKRNITYSVNESSANE